VVLLQVAQRGGIACHTGRERCFYRILQDGRWVDTEAVLEDPAAIYRTGAP
jgi:phosphoribosyl-AMP cyclohydrolase